MPKLEKELLSELEMYPNHPQAYYELGDIEYTAGNTKQAEGYYLKALKYEPRLVEAHLALEKLYTAAEEYDKSLEHLRAAIKVADDEPTAHYRLAQVYRRMGKLDDAQAELKIFEARRRKKSSSAGLRFPHSDVPVHGRVLDCLLCPTWPSDVTVSTALHAPMPKWRRGSFRDR